CAPDEYDDLISGTCSHLPKNVTLEHIERNLMAGEKLRNIGNR
ncbi:hypothetical protein ACNI4W_04400, partial [Klebsiella pneumoniae]